MAIFSKSNMNKIIDGTIKGVGKGLSAAHKASRKVDPRGPILDNLYTGTKEAAWPAALVMAGAVAVGVQQGMNDDIAYNTGRNVHELSLLQSTIRRAKPGASERMESPMMLADAQYNPRLSQQTASNADDLGTSGSMVFGMHNSNKGGYL